MVSTNNSIPQKNLPENNDYALFEAIYLRFYSKLYAFSQSILHDTHLAEDAVEDVFMKLWENRHIIPTIKNLSYYLFVATKHTCLNIIRKQKRITYINWDDVNEDFHLSFLTPEEKLLTKENLKAVEHAINDLPYKCRLIFYMVKQEGLKHKEIAQILDISVKTIEAQIGIALKRIAEKISFFIPRQGKITQIEAGLKK